jgi:glycosyltransferase involved in cell wall biosynthesis
MVQTSIVAVWARRVAGYPKRLVVVEQNNLSTATSHGKSIRDRMLPALARRFFPWADSVVGVSIGVVDDLKQQLPNIPADRFRVIFNPIVTPDISEQAKASVDHPWLQQGTPVLVAAGRLHTQKDFPVLIQAFARVRSARQARLLILGEGPNRAGLEALIQSLGLSDDVGLPGHTDNPYAYFARAAAFVLSSRWEGLPTVLIEALSCGAPVIATDCPSGPREILADGRYGPLVPVGDVAALAAAMNTALDGDLPAPPEESWRPYMVDAVVDDYLEVFGVDD